MSSLDYTEIAKKLMEYLSSKELEPRPHYRILLASYQEDETEKVWETGIERHEIGYSFVDINPNTEYTTVFSGFVKVGVDTFTPLKIVIKKSISGRIAIRVFRGRDYRELREREHFEIEYIDNDHVYLKIPFGLDLRRFSMKYLELEIIKRIRRLKMGQKVFLKIINKTQVEHVKSSKSFEFGHILEFEVTEKADGSFKIPIRSYKGYSLLPQIDLTGLEGVDTVHNFKNSKESFDKVYIVANELKFWDYYIADIEILQMKSSGISVNEFSQYLAKELGISLHESLVEYIRFKIESKGSTLYRFQVDSIKSILEQLYGERKPVLITARTAAGKTEAFIIPIINYLLHQKELYPNKKGTRVFLMYPTKALANDQLQRIFELLDFVNSWNTEQITLGIYHGDIEEKIKYDIPIPLKCVNHSHGNNKPRLKVKKGGILICPECNREYPFVLVDRNSILSNPPDILITTPDIVNYAMAFDKDRHALFHSKDNIYPEVVVLDEFHLFYSIFGKNVSLMLKRLEALIDQYSKGTAKKIQFIGASATIKNPKDFGSLFFDSDVVHVGTKFEDYDYSRTLKKTTIFAMPLAYRMVDTAAYSLLSLLKLNQSDGITSFKTLVFVNTLTICDMIKSSLGRRASASKEFQALIEKIGVHNSTYTKQERAEIEEKFNRGELFVLVATNTLEVGVDFKDIDILMLYGVPYSFNSYLQRIGRAGRTRDAIVYVLLNPNNPIDITYYRDALLISLNPEVF